MPQLRESVSILSPRAIAVLNERRMLLITKSSRRSRVHRRAAMDSVVVKQYRDGTLTGLVEIVGLFTSTAYVRSTRSIPYLRRKVASVVARAGFEATSHSGKALVNVMETYPRDELFQIDEGLLYRFALIILELGERPRVRVLPRLDPFERFVSVLVYVPRDRYGSAARAAIGEMARGGVRRTGRIIRALLSRRAGRSRALHHRAPRRRAFPSAAQRARGRGRRLVKTWSDGLMEALATVHDGAIARSLLATFEDAFTPAYRETFAPETAVTDITTITALSFANPLAVDFQSNDGDDGKAARLKVWSLGRPIPLSERVPELEHMGFTVVDRIDLPRHAQQR